MVSADIQMPSDGRRTLTCMLCRRGARCSMHGARPERRGQGRGAGERDRRRKAAWPGSDAESHGGYARADPRHGGVECGIWNASNILLAVQMTRSLSFSHALGLARGKHMMMDSASSPRVLYSTRFCLDTMLVGLVSLMQPSCHIPNMKAGVRQSRCSVASSGLEPRK